MKILYVNVVVDYSSTGRLVRDLAEGAKEKGHEVKIVYSRKNAKSEVDVVKVGSKIDTAWHGFMTKVFGRHGLHSKRATREVIQQISEFKPDIIHLHNLHGYYLHVPMLLKYLQEYNKPIIWTVHDFWLISGSAAYFHYYGCDKWDNGCIINTKPSEYPGSYFYTRQKKNFQWKKELLLKMKDIQYVTVSNWQRKELQKSYLGNYPITTIYNGLDLDLFHTKTKHSDSKKIELLAVANDWKKAKGLDDLLELAKRLEENEHLTLVGLSDKQLKHINNTDTLTVLGRTDGLEELVKCYQKADVYLNLSYEETMGMTTAEALACGTPCVTYDQTAVPEMIDKKVGQVVPAGNIEAVLEAVRNVKQRKINPQVCREYAEKKFDKENMINAYLKLYENLNEGE